MLESIIESFKYYVGYGNCLGQKDLDQGDSSQRDGHFFALAGLLKASKDFMGRDLSIGYSMTIRQHETSSGLYRRSPDPSYWGYNPNNFSRDQHQVLRIAMAVMGDTKRVRESAKAMFKRLGFHQNYHIGTDVPVNKSIFTQLMIKVYKLVTGHNTDYWKVPDLMTPSELSVIIRGTNAWYLYPLLYLLDLTLLVDLKLRKDDNWDQDNMMALQLLYVNSKYPTFISRMVMKKYLKTNFMDRIKNYYKVTDGANGLQPMATLFEVAFKELQK